MKITIDARELAHDIAAQTKPGQAFPLNRNILKHVLVPSLSGHSEAEWIMEQIVGSSYEWSFYANHDNNTVVFQRLGQPLTDGRRTYVSPDRRHLFEKLPDGTFKPRRTLGDELANGMKTEP